MASKGEFSHFIMGSILGVLVTAATFIPFLLQDVEKPLHLSPVCVENRLYVYDHTEQNGNDYTLYLDENDTLVSCGDLASH